ncbi:MAG: membrane protein insertion efficiency factor YidD [Deltaproteobacteria bacterium]|nr:MAG: membrane protein insertion efficiency factor YidD [Deltaproteobacteria bacterium]
MIKATLLACIRAYQLVISPWTLPSCRFTPSCSEYARQAIAAFGAGQGGVLAIRRLLRCHPFHPGGYDPVESQ